MTQNTHLKFDAHNLAAVSPFEPWYMEEPFGIPEKILDIKAVKQNAAIALEIAAFVRNALKAVLPIREPASEKMTDLEIINHIYPEFGITDATQIAGVVDGLKKQLAESPRSLNRSAGQENDDVRNPYEMREFSALKSYYEDRILELENRIDFLTDWQQIIAGKVLRGER